MKDLKQLAKQYYDLIKRHIERVDALMEVDDLGLWIMANDLALYISSIEAIRKEGPVQISPNGHSQITGHFTVIKECKASFLKFSDKFGLSPKDREKILKFKKPLQEADALDELV